MFKPDDIIEVNFKAYKVVDIINDGETLSVKDMNDRLSNIPNNDDINILYISDQK